MLRRGSWLIALLVVLGVLAAGVGGCAWGRSDVGIVGDSLVVQVTPNVEAATEGNLDVEIAAVPGATLGDMVNDAAFVAARRPSVLVVNLGSNDVIKSVPPEQSAVDLERIVDQFGSARCVVLVTVNENMFSYEEGYLTERAVATNAALGEVAARRSMVVLDWNEVLATQRQTPGAPDMLFDTIHVTPYGADVLTLAFLDAVANRCPSN